MLGSRLLLATLMMTAFLGCAREEKAMPAPRESEPWVIRTDFSDDDQWQKVR
jgi:hypothetical protein